MKKTIALFMAVSILSVLLSGCADRENKAPAASPLAPVTQSAGPPGAQPEHGPDSSLTEPEEPPANDGVDVDLTALSSTMVYGEVFNIMMNPDSYVGKTIKMRGLYYTNYYEPTAKYYHFVVIEDATACCAQGLEFMWVGAHAYPDDYPEEETEIEVTGVLESYEEDAQIWYRVLTDAVTVV